MDVRKKGGKSGLSNLEEPLPGPNLSRRRFRKEEFPVKLWGVQQ